MSITTQTTYGVGIRPSPVYFNFVESVNGLTNRVDKSAAPDSRYTTDNLLPIDYANKVPDDWSANDASPETEEGQNKTKKSCMSLLTDFLLEAGPFLNEIANVLTHSFKSFAWLYKEPGEGVGLYQLFPKLLVDFGALTAMAANGVHKAVHYFKEGASAFVSGSMGVWEAAKYLVCSYLIPAVAIPFAMKKIPATMKSLDRPIGKFGIGLAVIGLLEIGVHLLSSLDPKVKEFAEWVDKIINSSRQAPQH